MYTHTQKEVLCFMPLSLCMLLCVHVSSIYSSIPNIFLISDHIFVVGRKNPSSFTSYHLQLVAAFI